MQNWGDSRNSAYMRPNLPRNQQIITNSDKTFDTPNFVDFIKNILVGNIRSCFFFAYHGKSVATLVYHSQLRSPTPLGASFPKANGKCWRPNHYVDAKWAMEYHFTRRAKLYWRISKVYSKVDQQGIASLKMTSQGQDYLSSTYWLIICWELQWGWELHLIRLVLIVFLIATFKASAMIINMYVAKVQPWRTPLCGLKRNVT